jgi:DNA repair protein RecO (recombination protein O)
MKIHSFRGIVLRATQYSDADLILEVLGQQGDKISFLARGARKSRRRFAGGVLQPLNYVQGQYQISRTVGKLSTLTEAQLVYGFEGLRKDYDRLRLGLSILESGRSLAQEGDVGAQSLFDLIGNSLKALKSAQDVQIFYLHFLVKILWQQGVLEFEEWMKEFLENSILKSVQSPALDGQIHLMIHRLESKLKSFIQSGSTDSTIVLS